MRCAGAHARAEGLRPGCTRHFGGAATCPRGSRQRLCGEWVPAATQAAAAGPAADRDRFARPATRLSASRTRQGCTEQHFAGDPAQRPFAQAGMTLAPTTSICAAVAGMVQQHESQSGCRRTGGTRTSASRRGAQVFGHVDAGMSPCPRSPPTGSPPARDMLGPAQQGNASCTALRNRCPVPGDGRCAGRTSVFANAG